MTFSRLNIFWNMCMILNMKKHWLRIALLNWFIFKHKKIHSEILILKFFNFEWQFCNSIFLKHVYDFYNEKAFNIHWSIKLIYILGWKNSFNNKTIQFQVTFLWLNFFWGMCMILIMKKHLLCIRALHWFIFNNWSIHLTIATIKLLNFK